MSNTRLDTLLHRFTAATLAHYESLEAMDETGANRHAAMISRLLASILCEGDDGSRGLAGLIEHDNPVVAGMAAVCVLDLHTKCALTVLKALAKQDGMLGFRASVAIERWRNGEWRRP